MAKRRKQAAPHRRGAAAGHEADGSPLQEGEEPPDQDLLQPQYNGDASASVPLCTPDELAVFAECFVTCSDASAAAAASPPSGMLQLRTSPQPRPPHGRRPHDLFLLTLEWSEGSCGLWFCHDQAKDLCGLLAGNELKGPPLGISLQRLEQWVERGQGGGSAGGPVPPVVACTHPACSLPSGLDCLDPSAAVPAAAPQPPAAAASAAQPLLQPARHVSQQAAAAAPWLLHPRASPQVQPAASPQQQLQVWRLCIGITHAGLEQHAAPHAKATAGWPELRNLAQWLAPHWWAGSGAHAFDAAELYAAAKPHGNEPQLQQQPPQLRPQLRSYQRRAVAWMLHRELQGSYLHLHGSYPPQPAGLLHPLWHAVGVLPGSGAWVEQPAEGEASVSFYINLVHGGVAAARFPAPPPIKGGILCDEMVGEHRIE